MLDRHVRVVGGSDEHGGCTLKTCKVEFLQRTADADLSAGVEKEAQGTLRVEQDLARVRARCRTKRQETIMARQRYESGASRAHEEEVAVADRRGV